MPPGEQILMGMVIAACCLALLRAHRWFLSETHKGLRLVRWFGEEKAVWMLRGLLIIGAILGALLAVGLLQPIRW